MVKEIKNILGFLHKKGNILKIVSNSKRGTIKVYNKRGELVLKKTNLTKEQIETIEDSFLGYIAKKLNTTNNRKTKRESFDPMVA